MTARLEPSYGRTKDGLLAARVGGEAYIAVPREHGGFLIHRAERAVAPIEEMSAKDAGGDVESAATPAEFRRFVEDQAEDLRQKNALGRKDAPVNFRTPRGPAHVACRYADGVVRAKGPSIDGFLLSQERNDAIPRIWRREDRWYDDWKDWSKVAATFPEIFTSSEKRQADKLLRIIARATYEPAIRELAARGVPWKEMAAQGFRRTAKSDSTPVRDDQSGGESRKFRVRWEIDVEALDDIDAAQKATAIMQAIDHAPAFDVRGPDGEQTEVDLHPENDEDAWLILEERRKIRLAEIEALDAPADTDPSGPSL